MSEDKCVAWLKKVRRQNQSGKFIPPKEVDKFPCGCTRLKTEKLESRFPEILQVIRRTFPLVLVNKLFYVHRGLPEHKLKCGACDAEL